MPKAKVLDDRLTVGKFPPVPVKSTTCVLLGAGELSAIVIWAVSVPVTLGVKVTVIVHWPRVATEPSQVLICEKSAVSAPVSAMLVIVSAVLPPLVRVTVCGALVELRDWIGKTKPAGLSDTPPEGTTFDTKASQLPPGAACNGFTRGKSKEHVWPVT